MEFNDIKLLDNDVDFSKIKPFDWDLVLNGRPYYVCRIDGYSHSISWCSGLESRGTLWCYPRDEKPSIDNLVEYTLKEPVSWGVEYAEKHKTKCKWDEVSTISGGGTTITRNGKPFYRVGGNREYSVMRALNLINNIQDHPLEFNTINFDTKMIGRKIWWRSQPGIISHYVHGQCCVIVEPDGFDMWKIPPEFEKEDCLWYDERDIKLDCLEDGHVWWFRD